MNHALPFPPHTPTFTHFFITVSLWEWWCLPFCLCVFAPSIFNNIAAHWCSDTNPSLFILIVCIVLSSLLKRLCCSFHPSALWSFSLSHSLSLSLYVPFHLCFYLTAPPLLSWVDMYLPVPPPICFAISLGLSMLLEERGMYLHLPHPSARAHYCQQTALSFTETSELTALQI